METKRFLSLLLLLSLFGLSTSNTMYNVQNFGAKSNGLNDCTKAFLSAWAAACGSTGPSTIYVPPGQFLIGSALFNGNVCKSSSITIKIDGTLVAPSNFNVIGSSGNWLKFERVTGVSILGGTLDGQGTGLWTCKNSGKNCPKGATSLAFYNSRNIVINGLASLNSQQFHILFDGCQNTRLEGVKVSASGNSPNTDGIHLQQSSGVTILNSQISTGDDCISIGPGNSNVWIEGIHCGPGHGISIGSLGWDMQEPGVQNVTVKSVQFTGTENGLRVKTWARPSNGFVRGVLFQDVTMSNVENPIIIDQNYCPDNNNCPNQASGIRISDIKYQDVHGTSATSVAVKFDCSKRYPCAGITLQNVDLIYGGQPALASCSNAGGTSSGVVEPSSCL